MLDDGKIMKGIRLMTGSVSKNMAGPGKRRLQPLVAWRAVKALLADKEDTGQVFVAIRAMSGPSDDRNYRRFARDPMGRRILAENRSLLNMLSDQTALAALPAGSLGRAYLDFVQGENLSADGLVDASEAGRQNYFLPDQQLFSDRIRDMHDLWHVAAGYGRDGLGELCLLAFSYKQLGNLGIALIILMGARAGAKDNPGAGIWAAIREGYRLGRQAAWLPAADWERLLGLPMETVRQELGLHAPVRYRQALAHVHAREAAGEMAGTAAGPSMAA